MAPSSSKISKFPGLDPRPIVAPVNISDLLREGDDPTREIRRYIEQLQEVSREAYARQVAIEEEREQILADLARARNENESLRDECRETRRDRDALSERAGQYDAMLEDFKHRVESTERQRLDAVRQREDTMKFYKESQRQVEETMRIKDEAVKQRDAFSRQRDTAKKERDDIAARLTQTETLLAEARKVATDFNREEIQKQLTAIRQARDASASQCSELKLRISQLEDDVAIMSYDRDVATQAIAKVNEEAAKAKLQGDQLLADAAVREEALKDEAEELRKKTAALKRRNATLSEGIDSLTTEVQMVRAGLDAAATTQASETTDLRREIEKLAQERETEMVEYGNKLDELRSAHANELQLARQQYEAAMNERDAARVRAQEREAEVDAVRSQLEETRSVMDRLGSEASERANEIEVMHSSAQRAETAERALEEMRSALAEAQEQIAQHAAAANALESQLAEQGADLVEHQQQREQAEKAAREHENLIREHEEHRLQIIEVSARLATAHGEIKELSATLAEARLRMKSASARPGSADALAGEDIDPAIRASLTLLRKTFQEYLRQPADFNLLNDLQNHAQHVADRARETGQSTVQRVSGVLAALTRELYEMPEQATPPTMRSVGQGIEFVATLLREQELDRRVNLADVRAFAVDDDHSVLDAVCESLQAAGLDASTTDSAGAALAELAGSHYDLIILDVNLPELDGLELCSHVREMPLHLTTPVIFITGHASLENRVQFSLRGGNELMIKPFNLLELALRSVSLIIKAKLKPKV